MSAVWVSTTVISLLSASTPWVRTNAIAPMDLRVTAHTVQTWTNAPSLETTCARNTHTAPTPTAPSTASARPGYARQANGSCSDQDECAERTHRCSPHATCENASPWYRCQCRAGFIGDGYVCHDNNECLNNNHHCHANANCTNVIGSFMCQCNSGYDGNGEECQDVNECEKWTHKCRGNTACRNTHGAYECLCLPGYARNAVTRLCDDRDECTDAGGLHACHDNATCVNTPGSYRCECFPGHEGDGTSCMGKNNYVTTVKPVTNNHPLGAGESGL